VYQLIACTPDGASGPTRRSRRASGSGPHAEARALLEHEGALPQDGQESRRDRSVERAPRGRRRRLQRAGCRGTEKITVASSLATRATSPRTCRSSSTCSTMSKAQTRSEGAIREWQGSDLAERRETAVSLQAERAGRLTSTKDVPAMGSRGRRPGPDLESGRRRGRERGEQRPGVETLRRDHVARRPERVVEASVGGPRARGLQRARALFRSAASLHWGGRRGLRYFRFLPPLMRL